MNHDGGNSGGDRSGNSGGRSGRWIWILLVVAVVGVLVAKHAGKPEASPPAAPEKGESGRTAVEPVGPRQPLPRLLDLGAGTCVQCKMMTPVLDELKTTYAGRLAVAYIDVRENPDAVVQYGIKIIPTQIFYDADGKERFRHEGFYDKDRILAKWRELGVDLAPAAE